MQIIPVLDLLNGVVVRGIAGERDKYRPVESVLTDSSEPLAVASAFRDQLGLSRLYVADLDAILHSLPNLECYERLAAEGFSLMVDAGLRSLQDAERVLSSGAETVISGLETSAGPNQLRELCQTFGPDRILFSLDLKNGIPLASQGAWRDLPAEQIARMALQAGAQQMILLDLAQVGTGRGPATEQLCLQVQQFSASVQLIAGGGVRNLDDLRKMSNWGIHGVLLASVLHNGSVNRSGLREIANSN